jgi:hypothetical protein
MVSTGRNTSTAPTPVSSPSISTPSTQVPSSPTTPSRATPARASGPSVSSSIQPMKGSATSTTRVKLTHMSARKIGRPSHGWVRTASSRSVRERDAGACVTDAAATSWAHV